MLHILQLIYYSIDSKSNTITSSLDNIKPNI